MLPSYHFQLIGLDDSIIEPEIWGIGNDADMLYDRLSFELFCALFEFQESMQFDILGIDLHLYKKWNKTTWFREYKNGHCIMVCASC